MRYVQQPILPRHQISRIGLDCQIEEMIVLWMGGKRIPLRNSLEPVGMTSRFPQNCIGSIGSQRRKSFRKFRTIEYSPNFVQCIGTQTQRVEPSYNAFTVRC